MTSSNPERSGPLGGLRVVELAGLGPAPFAAMLLADMGADVLRVERPHSSDGRFSATAPEFDLLNRSRRCVALDLRHPDGVGAVLRLVEKADALIEGFRPGVTERLGLGPEQCWQRNRKLVYARMTGWGQDGPWARTAGHDVGYLAVTGALHAMGRAGGPPQIPLNVVGDFGGGSTYLVMGLLAALWEAARSGHGQVVDAAIVDGAASLSTMVHGMLAGGAWRDERGVNLLDSGYPAYDVYEAADGEWLAVGPLEAKFYAEFLAVLGIDDAPARDDRANWPALRARIAERIASRPSAEWQSAFDGTDACVAPVLSLAAAADHPHLAARSTFVEVEGISQPAPAPRFSRTPSAVQSPPARPGEHTRAALLEWGIGDVDALIESGVAVQAGGMVERS